ncbi:hypothetical protein OAZ20_04870 [Paracoccaceae bacterium]|nr:hypothetical protein [Paracoccaceae bacterium]
MSSNSADKSDKKLPSKEKLDLIYKMFEGHFRGDPVFHVWEVKGELILGLGAEIGYKLLTEGDAKSFTEDALWDDRIFDLFISGMAYALRNELSIPEAARLLLANYLENPSIRPPKTGGRNSDDNFDWTLGFALNDLRKVGINPTKNEATDPEKKCGIDIILDILEQLGERKDHTHESIRRRYQRAKKKFPYMP